MDSIRFLWVGSVLMSAVVGSDAVLQNFTGVPCRYDIVNSGLKVDCSRRSLTAIPSNLTEETTILDMSSNRLSKLANNSLCGLPNIMSLNFQSNNLSNMIERGAFRLLPNLNSTALANNNITSLPTGLFSKNGKLQAVNLANNRLDSFSVNVFNSVSTLRVVDVTHNFIDRVCILKASRAETCPVFFSLQTDYQCFTKMIFCLSRTLESIDLNYLTIISHLSKVVCFNILIL